MVPKTFNKNFNMKEDEKKKNRPVETGGAAPINHEGIFNWSLNHAFSIGAMFKHGT